MINVVINGFGRMGQAIARLAAEDKEVHVLAAVAGSQTLAQERARNQTNIRVVASFSELDASPDVVIDFSLPDGTHQAIDWCFAEEVALVCGTTGLSDEQLTRLRSETVPAPVLYARNMSLGVNVMQALTRLASQTLPASAEAEIVEAHHTGKIDAPSGTALALAEEVAATRSQTNDTIITGRPKSNNPRKPDEITIHSLRLGTVPGEHAVHFAFGDELLTISHRAGTRDIFAAGALAAAKWLSTQKPGSYTMTEMLGLPTSF